MNPYFYYLYYHDVNRSKIYWELIQDTKSMKNMVAYSFMTTVRFNYSQNNSL